MPSNIDTMDAADTHDTVEHLSNDNFVRLFHELGHNEQNWQTPKDWFTEDLNDPGYQLMTGGEIVPSVMDAPPEWDAESDEDTDAQLPVCVSHVDACNAFENCIKRLEIQMDTDPVHHWLCKGWRGRAAKNHED